MFKNAILITYAQRLHKINQSDNLIPKIDIVLPRPYQPSMEEQLPP
jgi:hypothetical protein